jgi:hypothetical protein
VLKNYEYFLSSEVLTAIYIYIMELKYMMSCSLNLGRSRSAIGGGEGTWTGLIDLAQVREWWRALLNAVMNCQVPYNPENFLTS